MDILDETPLSRAQAKCEQLERELKKCPDFHLYLIAQSREDRKRMERTLMTIPHFRLWHALKDSARGAKLYNTDDDGPDASRSRPQDLIRGFFDG
jgi:hypothetical protein